MTKRTIDVIYDNKLDKKELYENAKQEIKDIYNSLSNAHLNDKEQEILNIKLNLDNKDNYFRLLFLLSVYCSYFHKIKNKIDIKNINLTDLNKECFKKHNFVILDISNIHYELLQDISIYFNTDANNLEPITGKILHDLHNINIKYHNA